MIELVRFWDKLVITFSGGSTFSSRVCIDVVDCCGELGGKSPTADGLAGDDPDLISAMTSNARSFKPMWSSWRHRLGLVRVKSGAPINGCMKGCTSSLTRTHC